MIFADQASAGRTRAPLPVESEGVCQTVNVLIGSGGRRNYLVKWFREAMEKLGLNGEICVIDANPHAPALVDGDRARVVPELASPSYGQVLNELCAEWEITLAFSLNDYELAHWEGPLAEIFERHNVLALTLPSTGQRFAEDKLSYPRILNKFGLRTPAIMSGTEIVGRGSLPQDRGRGFVVKNRFGSGSAGLVFASADQVRDALYFQAEHARDRHGQEVGSIREGLASLVVQTRVEGLEHGIDVVNDFDSVFQGVLARRKLRMRSGETDQATVVDPSPFMQIGRVISKILRHRGLIDSDVIVAGDDCWIIDINPRFGGGYPFSHMGGADVPACYLAWQTGMGVDDTWLRPQLGVTSAKTEALALVLESRGGFGGE